MQWLGHASFYFTSPQGIRVITDPYGPQIIPGVPTVEADLVTISHEHWDHNYIQGVTGQPEIWRGLTADGNDWQQIEATLKDVHGFTVPVYHDDSQGSKRGKNSVFVLEMGELRLAHLGDLGHILTEEQCQRIGSLDVLMIPVGGYFTIGPEEAWQIVEMLRPRLVLPMHYLVGGMQGFPITGVDRFTAGRANVRHLGQAEIDLRKENLPEETEVWVLPLARK